MRKYIITVSLLFLFSFTSSIVNAKTGNKVLVISSYGNDYVWSNRIVDGLSVSIKDQFPNLELNIEYLSSEKFSNTNNWISKINVLLSNYNEHLPVAIVLISDEAWMAYRSADISRFADVPLLLCAVKPNSIKIEDYNQKYKQLKLSDFSSTSDIMKTLNATGILRRMNTKAYADLMIKFNPLTDGFVSIFDDRFYGIYTNLIFKDYVNRQFPTLSFESFSAYTMSTDSLFKCLPLIKKNKSVLLTSWLTEENGFEFSKDYTYKRMSDLLDTPIFITNNIGIEKNYFIGGYFNDGSFWGAAAGRMLIKLLQGESPQSIKPITYKDTDCNINWNTYHEYKFEDSSLPTGAIFINQPKSVFQKYSKSIISVAIIFIIIIVILIYISANHLKLKKSQKLTLKLMERAEISKIQLNKTHANLLTAIKKAEESDRLKSAFIANMSHEIRTPLNAIIGFTSIFAQLENSEERAEAERIIKDNSDQLLGLISDILVISEIESGKSEIINDDIDPFSICSDLINILKNKYNENVQLFFDAPQENITINCDYNKLMQVMMILTQNAIKFTSEGSIHIGYQKISNYTIKFYVTDTGIGITPEMQNEIFERFVKVDNYMTGTGLGLPIVKAIINLLGGRITVESELGKGSTFQFTIPIDGVSQNRTNI